ncbi:hypothetical protein [Nocardia wallacei]|uniref:hypothetical protein n=1 Tax=Nocardia wallacei TaxID=480035 RepID=UPI002453848D|nr:hypothetical protein [Nocardia wallacei]
MLSRHRLPVLAVAAGVACVAVAAVRAVAETMPRPVELSEPAWWCRWADMLDPPPPVVYEHQDLYDHHLLHDER